MKGHTVQLSRVNFSAAARFGVELPVLQATPMRSKLVATLAIQQRTKKKLNMLKLNTRQLF
jgi:hypothetical protein